ncbi:MAG: hypothetical protein JW717_05715 [Marinilabiliaceae bacterium]|nr:hypothetical protein [Marinilabiliaceae bacterium]
MKRTILTVVVALFMAVGAFAQEFSISTDVVSRYVWRGSQFAAASVQPGIGYSNGGLSLGAWGSYDLAAGVGSELDLYVGYDFDFGLGLIVTDYFFPQDPISAPKAGYFEFDSLHTVEVGATYSVGKISLGAYVYATADNNDMYFEASYAFNDNLSLTVGAGNESYTDSGEFNVCNMGLSYSKEAKLTESWTVSPFASFILNPNREQVFLVVGVSF